MFFLNKNISVCKSFLEMSPFRYIEMSPLGTARLGNHLKFYYRKWSILLNMNYLAAGHAELNHRMDHMKSGKRPMLTLFVEALLAKKGLRNYLLKALKPFKAPKERKSSTFYYLSIIYHCIF